MWKPTIIKHTKCILYINIHTFNFRGSPAPQKYFNNKHFPKYSNFFPYSFKTTKVFWGHSLEEIWANYWARRFEALELCIIKTSGEIHSLRRNHYMHVHGSYTPCMGGFPLILKQEGKLNYTYCAMWSSSLQYKFSHHSFVLLGLTGL